MPQQSISGSISRSVVRDCYLRQDEISINRSLENTHGLPRFKVFSQELEANTVDRSAIPQRLVNSMFASDLEEFQSSWCLESSINDNVIHNFIQGLYATTYVSGRFALPKDCRGFGYWSFKCSKAFFQEGVGDCSILQSGDSTIQRCPLLFSVDVPFLFLSLFFSHMIAFSFL